ncbi:hypothetical protein [Pseudarthrobacter sp. DSP2-3-2b1]|uniref:hypothetical protein n=1 Tax=Pseudarthrobacter sp. DSP2-3-2b1 TaxID=2804661 RepID=UPI003CF8D9D5
MSHEYILTDDDAAPADATHGQDILELSMLTMPQPGAPVVDISWEKSQPGAPVVDISWEKSPLNS